MPRKLRLWRWTLNLLTWPMAQDVQRTQRHATPQPHRIPTGSPQDPHKIPTGSARMFEGAMPAVLGAALPCAVACPTVANNRGISQLVGKNLQYHKKTKKMRLRFLSAKAAKCHAQCLPFCQFVIRTGRIYMCNLYHDCCILVS